MDITITMNEVEIKSAIKAYIAEHNITTAVGDNDISLVASRGTSGHSAVIAVKGSMPAIPPAPASDVKNPEVDAAPEMKERAEDPFAIEPPSAPAKARKSKATAVEPAVTVAGVEAVVEDLFANESAPAVTAPAPEAETVEVTEEQESLFG